MRGWKGKVVIIEAIRLARAAGRFLAFSGLPVPATGCPLTLKWGRNGRGSGKNSEDAWPSV